MPPGLSISFGASNTSSSAPPAPKPSTKKRPHASLGDDSDDERTPAKQVVTHFNTSGAINASAPKSAKGPLVITPQANRDWREASKAVQAQKRAKYGLPPAEGGKSAKEREEEIRRIEEAKKPVWGLNVKKRKEGGEEVEQDDGEGDGKREVEVVQEEAKPKTEEERAMDALMGVKHQSDLTIPAASEEEAFQRDFKDAPDMATLDQYAAVPVEEFGAALLRGMGWKEGFGIGHQKGKKVEKAKIAERRPALLGIGAKEEAAVKEEMGAWGRGAKRSDQVYNPVVMRNKRTGEELTEQEMKEKMEEQAVKKQEADLDALAERRKAEDRERRKKEERKRRDEYSDEEYERRRKEKRRERERDDRDYDRRERRRSRDRGDRGDSKRDRDRDDRREKDRKRDYDRDDRDTRRHRDVKDSRDRDRKRDYRDDREDDRRRRH
ncbi:G-patch domain-containing protein [Elsinoe fawcettii]|nr:G-patch domain-containing protein [Elsinoe fawcettii]